MALRDVKVRFGADTTGFDQGLRSVQSGLKSLVRTSLALAGVGLGLKTISDSMKAFVGLESSVLRVNSLFGESSKYVDYFAKSTAKGFGMAENSAYQYAATYGNLFRSITVDSQENAKVTIAMLKASAVVASRTGRTMEDVMERIRSGLLGNTEAIEDLGINVNVGTLKMTNAFKRMANGRSWEQLTFYEQQQVRTLAILEQAHKNFGDEVQQGSAFSISVLTGAFKNLISTMGQFVNAGIQPVIKGLIQLVQWATMGLKALAALLGLKIDTSSSQSVDGQVKAQEALTDEVKNTGKAIKQTTAGFDVFNDISKATSAAPVESGAGASPFAGIPMPEFNVKTDTGLLDRMSEGLEKIKTLLTPTTTALQGLWSSMEPFRSFVAKGVVDFYQGFLVPVGSWVLGEGLPRLVEALSVGFAKVNWNGISGSLQRLWQALGPFAVNVGEGLLWLWENVLVPFGTWVVNDALPAFLGEIAARFGFFNEVIETLRPLGEWLWDEFLRPFLSWAGEKYIQWLDLLAKGFRAVSDWIRENQGLVQNIVLVIGSLAAAWGLVNLAIAVWNGVAFIAAGVTTILGGAIAFLTTPLGIATLAIGGLIAIGVLLYKNWDEVKAKAFELWDGIKAAFSPVMDFFAGLWDGVKKGFVGFVNFMIRGINNMVKGFLAPVNALISGWNATIGKVAGRIPTITIAIPEIPALAKGGVVYGQMQAIVGDNFNARQDPEVIAPLSTLKGMILEALIQKEIATGGNKEIRLILTLENGETLVDLLIDPMNSKAKNLGYAPVFKPA